MPDKLARTSWGMTPTSGPRANGSPREWDSTASRIEELELRLELERGRVQIRDLKALLAVYQQDNDRLRSILNHTLRERSPAEAHAHAPRSVGVDVSVGSSLPSAPTHHSHANAHGPSAGALLRAPWDRAVNSSSAWLASQHQHHQQQEGEDRGVHREDQRGVGSGGWRGLRTSCDFCTGSKIRCDGSKPACGNCQQRGIDCHYSAKRRPGPKPSRGASEDLSQAPPARRPRIAPYDRIEAQTTTTRTPLREPPIGRFYTTHTHSHAPSTTTTNTHSFSPIATQLASSASAAASDGSWRASFDDAQAMSLSPPHSPPDLHTRRAAF